MPTLFCCILNCDSESLTSKKRKIFYRLPQNSDRKQLWLNQIGDRIKYGAISSNSRICNSHFATGKPNLDSSHIDHVPTIFPWSSKEERAKSFQLVELYETKIKELEQKILAKAFLNASNDSKISTKSELTRLEIAEDYPTLPVESESIKFRRLNIKTSVSQPIVSVSNKPTVMDAGNAVTINGGGLISYLIGSLSHVNVPTANSGPLSVNISVPHGPLNLSQSFNQVEEHISDKDASDRQRSMAVIDGPLDLYKNKEPSAVYRPISQTFLAVAPLASQTEDATSRSCTCTKSSCLKLYCECFATGNLCSPGCTCNNCRNNNEHRVERAKIVSSYLERDPWVFNSKIDSQDVSKKHSKGCNCLKSSCLKNYCECFENKVFCSSLCRCRMCYNNEDHSHQNHREEVKIYPASHTSDSLSVLSENSPKDYRKRRRSNVKSEAYEDVSSNESALELNVKRRHLDPEVASVDNDVLSARSITSMDIPPVLPQEDDFTEEELAMMIRFKEQRSIKVEELPPPVESPAPRCPPLDLSSTANPAVLVPVPGPSVPPRADSNLLLTLSRSMGGPAAGRGGSSPRLTSGDLFGMLVSQQLLAPRPAPAAPTYSHVPPAGHPHVIPTVLGPAITTSRPHVVPASLSQGPVQSPCPPQSNGHQTPVTAAPLKPHLPAVATPSSSTPHARGAKLSTEDYVRRHIEAAEKAVRADNMRRDCLGSKKAIARQRLKTDSGSSPLKVSPSSSATSRHSGDDHAIVPQGPVSSSSPLKVVLSRARDGSYARRRRTTSDGRRWKLKYHNLRKSLHQMRTELRSIKVHMRADQSKIRRLEAALLYMSRELDQEAVAPR